MGDTPVYIIPREKKDPAEKQMQMMMMMQMLGGAISKIDQIGKDAEDRRLKKLEFMLTTGMDPDTGQPADPAKLPAAQRAVQKKAQMMSDIFEGKGDFTEEQKAAGGVIQPPPSQAEQTLKREDIAAGKEIAGTQAGAQKYAADVGAQTSAARTQADLTIAGMTQATTREEAARLERQHAAEQKRLREDSAVKAAEAKRQHRLDFLTRRDKRIADRKSARIDLEFKNKDYALKLADYMHKTSGMDTLAIIAKDPKTYGKDEANKAMVILTDSFAKNMEDQGPEGQVRAAEFRKLMADDPNIWQRYGIKQGMDFLGRLRQAAAMPPGTNTPGEDEPGTPPSGAVKTTDQLRKEREMMKGGGF